MKNLKAANSIGPKCNLPEADSPNASSRFNVYGLGCLSEYKTNKSSRLSNDDVGHLRINLQSENAQYHPYLCRTMP